MKTYILKYDKLWNVFKVVLLTNKTIIRLPTSARKFGKLNFLKSHRKTKDKIERIIKNTKKLGIDYFFTMWQAF